MLFPQFRPRYFRAILREGADMGSPQIVPDRDTLIKEAANALAQASDADVYLYNAEIRRPSDDNVLGCCLDRKRRSNASLILVTEGGDPDAAYRIARCFQAHYERFICIVPGYCKSAGTLITVGAHELVMTDGGELGPLDIQMSKKDELWESQSGLTVTAALRALHERSYSAFEHFFLTMKQRGRTSITLKTATEIAAKLTAGLFAPIFEQVDPLHVGESYRATAIASHYGARLAENSGNIDPDALEWIITQYPTHGFVIDRDEASSLFVNVRPPNKLERQLTDALGDRVTDPRSGNAELKQFLSDERKEEADNVATSEVTKHLPENPTDGKTKPDAGRNVQQAS
jgi:hypothetical protein